MQALIEKFFRGLGIEVTSVTVKTEADDVFVDIQTPDSPLLIGMHGKNLEFFQHIIGRMIEKGVGHFVHVHLEVNDYMKAKDERLFRFLDAKIAFVRETGKMIRIPNLTSYERKKAHHYVSELHIDGLSTKSEGEGAERSLHIGYSGPLTTSQRSERSTTMIGSDLSEDGVGI